MKPTTFKEQTTVFAKSQPQYQPLPAHVSDTPGGEVVSCWSLSFKERLILLFTGRMWMQLMMFRTPEGNVRPLTPSFLTVSKSDVIPKAVAPVVKPDGTPITSMDLTIFFSSLSNAVEFAKEKAPADTPLAIVVPDHIFKQMKSSIRLKPGEVLAKDIKLTISEALLLPFSKAHKFADFTEKMSYSDIFVAKLKTKSGV